MKLQRPLVGLQAAVHQVATAYQVLAVVRASMQDPLLAVEVTALEGALGLVEVKQRPALGLAVVVVSELQSAAPALACSMGVAEH